MPERALQELLERFGDEHIVLTAERLFVSSTLREEVWLLMGRDAPDLLREILDQAATWGIAAANADRQLSTYSGGEQVILALLLTLAVIRNGGHAKARLLLHNLLGSLSQRNRQRVAEMLRAAGGDPLRLGAVSLEGQDGREPAPV